MYVSICVMSPIAFGGKEPYMQDMNPWLESYFGQIKTLLLQLTTMPKSDCPKSTVVVDTARQLASLSFHLKLNRPALEQLVLEQNIPRLGQMLIILDEIESTVTRAKDTRAKDSVSGEDAASEATRLNREKDQKLRRQLKESGQLLESGGMFEKHNYGGGKSHSRFIRVTFDKPPHLVTRAEFKGSTYVMYSDDGVALYWKKDGNDKDNAKNSIPMSEITRVALGCTTSVFKKSAKSMCTMMMMMTCSPE